MAMAATLVKRTKTSGEIVGIFTLTASGSYSTGGDSLDFSTIIGFTNQQPDFVQIVGIAGYRYEYDIANKKVLVRQVDFAGGTVSKPTFTVKNGTAVANGTINLDADSASANVVGGTGITTDRTLTTTSPVGTPTISGVAANSQLPASAYPAGVTGDTIRARVTWISGVGL